MAEDAQLRPTVNYYDTNYGNFHEELYAEIRRDAFGEDIGTSGWQNAEEQDTFMPRLGLSKGKKLLDVACGSGGPALRIAEKTGCVLVGIDIHQDAILAARSLAKKRGMSSRTEFQKVDATGRLPFADAEFDAITCIDAIIHLPDRPRLLVEWSRVLKSGAVILFTDSTVVTGPLTKEEIAIRSSIGYFQFVPVDYDRSVLEKCGFRLLVFEDVTQNMADLAERRRLARESRSSLLRKIEGDKSYEGQQEFLEVTARIAKERRLSRFLYIAQKP